MSSSSNLSLAARSKLHLSGGGGGSSLHRWVLLKNAITGAQTPTAGSSSDAQNVNTHSHDSEYDDLEESDAFIFPDVQTGKHHEQPAHHISENQWLDSLLDGLQDDDDLEEEEDVSVSVITVDDEDEDMLLSPSISPMNSSEDLHAAYHYTSLFHPPLIRDLRESFNPAELYGAALPYLDDDESDDDSDAATPSLVSSMSGSSPEASMRSERSERPHFHVHVESGDNDCSYYPFETDPLPFPHDHIPLPRPYHSIYHQEC